MRASPTKKRPAQRKGNAAGRLTHPQRKARRKAIARFVQRGGSMAAAADKWGVSLATVKGACTECGVEWPAGKRGPKQKTL